MKIACPSFLIWIQIIEGVCKPNSTLKVRKTQTQSIPDAYDVNFAQLGS